MIPITGRPAGWCDHIARMWPVDAVVGENGAFYMRHDPLRASSSGAFAVDEPTRRADRARLAAIGARIVEAVPGCALASDQHYREADLAIDFCEDVPPLPRDAVDRIVELMQAAGMTAKVSSIHVNGWFGGYDKLAMTRTLLAEEFGIDLDAERERFVFAGDSPNDAPMFAFFPERGRRGQRARVRRSNRDAACVHHAGRSRCRIHRVLLRSAARNARPCELGAAQCPAALLDAQGLVPLRHALRARERADLELAGVPADREMDDRDVLGLAGARRDDRAEAGRSAGVERGERLGHRARLVRLDQHRVAGADRAAACEPAPALVTR